MPATAPRRPGLVRDACDVETRPRQRKTDQKSLWLQRAPLRTAQRDAAATLVNNYYQNKGSDKICLLKILAYQEPGTDPRTGAAKSASRASTSCGHTVAAAVDAAPTSTAASPSSEICTRGG